MKIELYPKTEVGTEILKDYDYIGRVKSLNVSSSRLTYEVECKSTFNPSMKNILFVKAKDDPNFNFKLTEDDGSEIKQSS